MVTLLKPGLQQMELAAHRTPKHGPDGALVEGTLPFIIGALCY